MTETFDYIIVGSGAAGSVIAARLAEDPSLRICVLEAGPPDHNFYLHVPGGFIKAVSNPKYTWQFQSEPSVGSGGRSINLIQGRTLGGSTSINGFNYNRGQREDFDTWAQMGNRGWSYDDILPLFRRTERKVDGEIGDWRGQDGNLPITDGDWRHPLCDAFIETAAQFGMPSHIDYNSGQQTGAGYFQRWILNGWRHSSAKAFLKPALKSKNLSVKTNVMAQEILLHDRKAVGIAFQKQGSATTEKVFANREVIISAGAVNSPKLLQLSGIGPGQLLQDHGIAVKHELPGVGENLRDHYMVRMVRRTPDIETINSMASGLPLLKQIMNWALGKPSILAIGPSVCFGFTHATDPTELPNIQLNFTPGSYKASVSGQLDDFDGATLGHYQLRPESTGYVRIKSPDPQHPPTIQPNYLTDPIDQQIVVDGMRLIHRIYQSAPLSGFCGPAEYSEEMLDDVDAMLQFAGENGNTAYHLMGTCRMAPADHPDAVVDNNLKVIGIDGLRVADASIMPTMLSANLAAGSYMIGEKASDLIRQN